MTRVQLPTGAGTFFHHMCSKCLWSHAYQMFFCLGGAPRGTWSWQLMSTQCAALLTFPHYACMLCLGKGITLTLKHHEEQTCPMCLGVSCVCNFLFAEYFIQIIWKPWLWIQSLFPSLGKVELFNFLLLPSFMFLFLFSSSLWWGVDKFHIHVVLSMFMFYFL